MAGFAAAGPLALGSSVRGPEAFDGDGAFAAPRWLPGPRMCLALTLGLGVSAIFAPASRPLAYQPAVICAAVCCPPSPNARPAARTTMATDR